MATTRIHPTDAQQELLEGLEVRLLETGELERWEALVRTHHYLGDATMVGECLRYVVLSPAGEWIALLGWASASWHLKQREAWLGWSLEQRRRRLRLIAQNARFLILPGVDCPNLASRVLALCCQRLCADWQAVHGHGVLLAESFVDPARFLGTCYRAAGWQALGRTKGFARAGREYYLAHHQPKELWVRALLPAAAALLRAPALPPALAGWEATPPARTSLHAPQLASLLQAFWSMTDVRRAQGRKHRVGSVLACAAVAVLAGACTYADMASVAAHLSQAQLRALRGYFQPKKRRYEPPSESTFWRVLSGSDPEELDRRLGAWLATHLPADEPLAIDGKALRGAKMTLFAAFSHSAQSVVAQVRVADQSNEIPAVAPLLSTVELEGRVITADALHTQQTTAHHLVQERGADYVLVVKDNQPTLRAQCERLLPESAFSPGTHGHRKGPRASRRARPARCHGARR